MDQARDINLLDLAHIAAIGNVSRTSEIHGGKLSLDCRASAFHSLVVWILGSFEIGVVAQRLGSSGKYDPVLCIGVVRRGDTTHYDVVANSSTSGVFLVGLKSGVPCIFGVLTCDNMEQALNRAIGKSGNKGAETALTVGSLD